MQLIFILSVLIHNFTIIPFYPLSEIGMSCQTMCETHLAKWHLNVILTITLLTHPIFSLLVNAWLRTKCSSLCEHLYSKNILDNPLCTCGATEDRNHFFLKCNRFSNQRQEKMDTVTHIHTPTINGLLYGSQELNELQNQQIFTAVQNFILKSKRFEIS